MSDSMTMHFVWLWYLYSMIVVSLLILKPARRPAQGGRFREPRAHNPASAPDSRWAEGAGDEPRR